MKTKAELKKAMDRLKSLQTEYMDAGKPMPQNVGEEFDTLAAEVKEYQDNEDRANRYRELESKGREVDAPAMPAPSAMGADPIIGYKTLGQLISEKPEYQAFINGNGQGAGLTVEEVKNYMVPVYASEVKADSSNVQGLIRPERFNDLVRTANTESAMVRLRDFIPTDTTTAAAVEFPVFTSFTNNAAFVAEGGVKPYSEVQIDNGTAQVKTIAHLVGVSENMLQDSGQVQGIIVGELDRGIIRKENYGIVRGSGVGQEFSGLLTVGLPAPYKASDGANAGSKLIENLRYARTTVVKKGLSPNLALMTPEDGDVLALYKGTDGHYAYYIATDPATGINRVHALRIVEIPELQDADGDRHVIVGDFTAGCRLWDRQGFTVAVGYVNDQFQRNQKSIRGERREAFGVLRTHAFSTFMAHDAV